MAIVSKNGRAYGWKKDSFDARDLKYQKIGFMRAALLPSSVDLRPNCPPVYNQESLGSCTGNAIAAAHQLEQITQKLSDIFTPSRLFIYYGEREMEGTIYQDAGAMIRDGIKYVADKGVCPESMWEYDTAKFAIRPSEDCYNNAANHTIASYERLDNTSLAQLKHCLADGYGFVFGIELSESFESEVVAKTGMVPIPKDGEQVIGGHAIFCVGYMDDIGCFIVRNSWGDNWGKDGYCFIKYEMMTDPDKASDFWTIRLVNDKDAGNQPKTSSSWWSRLFHWF